MIILLKFGKHSNKELGFKFDSLKSTMSSPMTSNDFFLKLSPVIASVKEGHMRLIPLSKKLTRKERINSQKFGLNPFTRFDFELFNNKLYINKNYSGDSSIKAGTEVVSVNNVSPVELISKYSHTFASGGSFSASSLISSNLKGSGRAIFEGEETGGAYNGTVAGMLPMLKLPKSKLNIRLGLARLTPYYKTDIDGRGIFPDIEIKPTLEDRINGNDPELKRVLNGIKTGIFE